MLKSILLSVFYLNILCVVNAQDTGFKRRTYKISATDEIIKKGYLASFSDSGVHISATPVVFSPYSLKKVGSEISYQNLSIATIRRKGSTGRGILIGALSGALSGVLLGYISGDDPECKPDNSSYWSGLGVGICNAFRQTAGEKAALNGTALGFTGGIVGAIVGAIARKKFIIGGNRDKFNSMRGSLLNRVTKTAIKNK